MSGTDFDPSGNSSFSFHVLAYILNLLFSYDFLCFSMYSMLRFDKAKYLSILFYLKDWGLNVFSEFINKAFILHYIFTELIILLYTTFL